MWRVLSNFARPRSAFCWHHAILSPPTSLKKPPISAVSLLVNIPLWSSLFRLLAAQRRFLGAMAKQRLGRDRFADTKPLLLPTLSSVNNETLGDSLREHHLLFLSVSFRLLWWSHLWKQPRWLRNRLQDEQWLLIARTAIPKVNFSPANRFLYVDEVFISFRFSSSQHPFGNYVWQSRFFGSVLKYGNTKDLKCISILKVYPTTQQRAT